MTTNPRPSSSANSSARPMDPRSTRNPSARARPAQTLNDPRSTGKAG
ncbi:MAG TPA: hypothetical protein VIO94_06610 [Phenylobacterium sp.]